MCVYSMVVDEFGPRFPDITIPDHIPNVPVTPWPAQITTMTPFDVREIQSLIAEFRRLLANAKEIDEKTGQADCEDPEKAKLVDRVNQLQALLNRHPEFVVVKKGGLKLEPGTYRVIDGKLYKVVEGSAALG